LAVDPAYVLGKEEVVVLPCCVFVDPEPPAGRRGSGCRSRGRGWESRAGSALRCGAICAAAVATAAVWRKRRRESFGMKKKFIAGRRL
jgi:hypothetical protein